MEALEVRNRKTASQLVIENNAEIEFEPSKKRFFCGTIVGYISPAVIKKIDNIEITDLQYAECRKPGEDKFVPCLMLVGKKNVTKKLGAALLRK